MSHPPRLKHRDVQSTVETRCPCGHPQVLRCHPLRRGSGRFEPFPTLFWLVCPRLTDALTALEHEGWVQRLSQRLEVDGALRVEVEADHEAYVQERWALLSAAERAEVERRGLRHELTERGVGGIRNRASVKCLHLHFAHHLARGSALGRVLASLADLAPCEKPA